MAGFLPNDIDRQVSYNKKKANDFARQKDLLLFYDTYYDREKEINERQKLQVNYDLYNGRLDVEMYDDPICFEIEGESIKFDNGAVTHYPLISQIANAMHGEIINRPFRPTAKDTGPLRDTLRSKKWNELIRDYLQSTVVNPLQEELLQSIPREQLAQLSPEQQQQFQAQLSQEVSARTPKEIMDFMQNDYRTPTERQAQQLLDYLVDTQDIRWKQSEGFKHAIITGEEVYYTGIRHDEPVFEPVNIMYFTCGGSQNTEWVQKKTWARYEQWLTYEDATQKYAEYLKPKHYKYLEGYIEPIGGTRKDFNEPKHNLTEQRFMYDVSHNSDHYEKKYGKVNYKTKEGQYKLGEIYKDVIAKYGGEYGKSPSNYGVREAHIVFRDKRKLRRVTRVVGGKVERFWMDEHYEVRPEDIKVVDVWVDEIWEGTILGTGSDPLFINIQPIPYQYKSVFNPFDVDLPYYGKKYNTHMNNTKNISLVDRGKAYQMDFDVEMSKLKRDLATNIGTVFVMLMGMKPDSWKWQEWLNTMKNSHLLLADPHKHGLNNFDPQIMRSVDLSKVSDIANRIQMLNFFRENLIQSMFFNSSRLGGIGQHATNLNIQTNTGASFNQTEAYFETHRVIVQKALDAYLSRAKIVYKDKPYKTARIFDDVTKADLELSPDFWYSELGVVVDTSNAELQQIELLKQQMLAFTQNGMSLDGVMELALADSRSDIINIIRRESSKIEQNRSEELAAQQQANQNAINADLQKEQQANQLKYTMHQENILSQERRAVTSSMTLANANDIDQNNQNDFIERDLEKARMDLEKHKDLLAIEEEKLEIAREKLEIERSKVN